jgi:hypothetical protein
MDLFLRKELEKYDKTILNKFYYYSSIKISPIITDENNTKICGFFCPEDQIIVISTHSKCDFKSTIHHELFHLIDYVLLSDIDDNEWNKLNKHKYTKNYDLVKLMPGFITNYGMSNIDEDKATLYEEFMLKTYSKDKLYYKYDDIVVSKFKLMFKRLIKFDENFEKIIKKNSNKKLYNYYKIIYFILMTFVMQMIINKIYHK